MHIRACQPGWSKPTPSLRGGTRSCTIGRYRRLRREPALRLRRRSGTSWSCMASTTSTSRSCSGPAPLTWHDYENRFFDHCWAAGPELSPELFFPRSALLAVNTPQSSGSCAPTRARRHGTPPALGGGCGPLGCSIISTSVQPSRWAARTRRTRRSRSSAEGRWAMRRRTSARRLVDKAGYGDRGRLARCPDMHARHCRPVRALDVVLFGVERLEPLHQPENWNGSLSMHENSLPTEPLPMSQHFLFIWAAKSTPHLPHLP